MATAFAHNFTSVRNPFLSQLEFDSDRARGQAIGDFMLQIMLASGMNIQHQVNDCEAAADWTESTSGTFDLTIEATIKRVGTNAIHLESTAACNGTQYVETRLHHASAVIAPDASGIKGQDWNDTQFVGFYQHFATAGHFTTLGDLQFALVNYLDGSGEVVGTKINVPVPTVEDKWQRVELDIKAERRDRVVAIRFYCANADAGDDIYIDNITRYLFSSGKGPMMGPCQFYPIASGEVLVRGDYVTLAEGNSNAEVTKQVAADKVNSIGIVVVGGTGVAGGTVHAAIQTFGPAFARANETITTGLGIEWATGQELDLSDVTSELHSLGKALVAGVADEDSLVFIQPVNSDS